MKYNDRRSTNRCNTNQLYRWLIPSKVFSSFMLAGVEKVR
jgi:hypothetical protein